MTTKDDVLKILNMSPEETDDLLKVMTNQAFIVSAQKTIDFIKSTCTLLTKEDKQIMDTCQSMLTNGQIESFEERKYFMEEMKKAAEKIKNKNLWTTAISIGVGAVVAILYVATHKK